MWRLSRSLVLLVLLGLTVSCQPVDPHVLKIGSNNWLGYQPFFAAQSLNYWDHQEVNVVELGSTTEVIRALYNGGLDGATLTLDELITVLGQGRNVKVLMVIDISYGGDTVIATPDVESINDLKGKRVAVENTALGAVMLDALLTKAELKLDNIEVIPTTYDRHEHVLKTGQSDAVITFEPVKTKLLAEGYRELFNSRQMPGEIVDVLVVSDEAYEKYPERISQLMKGFFKARNLIMAKDTTVLASMGKRTGLDTAAVAMGYEQLKLPDLEENKVLMQQCQTGFNGAVEKLMKAMLSRQLIEKSVDFKQACHNNLINELQL